MRPDIATQTFHVVTLGDSVNPELTSSIMTEAVQKNTTWTISTAANVYLLQIRLSNTESVTAFAISSRISSLTQLFFF